MDPQSNHIQTGLVQRSATPFPILRGTGMGFGNMRMKVGNMFPGRGNM